MCIKSNNMTVESRFGDSEMRLMLRMALLFLAASFAASSYATVVLTPADCTSGTCWTLDQTKNPDLADVQGATGVSGLSLLYKAEVGGSDSGTLAGSYDTTFSNSSTDPEDALIEWVGGLIADCDVAGCFLSVKDGDHEPGVYIFDISYWNGLMDIELDGFWPNGGAISNVAIWGGGTQVPAPGTLGLFGLGLMLAAAARNRMLARR